MIPRILRLMGLLLVTLLIGCSETAPLDPGPTTMPAIQASPTDTPPTLTPPAVTSREASPDPTAIRVAYADIPEMPCPVTLANGSTPPLESPQPGHHGNGELWTRLWDEGTVRFVPDGPGQILDEGRLVMGFEWWRGVPGELEIDSRPLDPGTPRVRARISGNYGGSGFQPVGISFPAEGCWEITGSVGDASLTFVTLVERVDEGVATTQPVDAVVSIPMLGWNEDKGQYEARLIDQLTGRDLPGRAPITAGGKPGFAWYNAFSLDGRKFASFEATGEPVSWDYGGGSGAVATSEAVLHLIDLEAWTEVTARLPTDGRAVLFEYSPDSTRLALTYLQRTDDGQQQINTLMVFDSATGDLVIQKSLPFKPSLLEYAEDRSELIVYGAAEGPVIQVSKSSLPQLLLLDAATLQVNWEREFQDLVSGRWCIKNCQQQLQFREHKSWQPAVVLSQDRHSLHIVHAAHVVLGADIWVARSWMERLLDTTAGVVEAVEARDGTRVLPGSLRCLPMAHGYTS